MGYSLRNIPCLARHVKGGYDDITIDKHRKPTHHAVGVLLRGDECLRKVQCHEMAELCRDWNDIGKILATLLVPLRLEEVGRDIWHGRGVYIEAKRIKDL